MLATTGYIAARSATAKARFLSAEGRPLFYADWMRALFIHYQIDPVILQPHIPFELDVREGSAYISLVAFTMEGLRFNWPTRLGKAAGRLAAIPAATHELLNVRTYVRHQDEPGIHFIAEWVPNALSAFLGPRTFGLPYRLGRLDYRHDEARGALRGLVEPAQTSGHIAYLGAFDQESASTCPSGSLDEFLLERYTAYTHTRGGPRLFRVWHEPWRLTQVDDLSLDDSAVLALGPWAKHLHLVHAVYSAGARDVWMGRPRRVKEGQR